MRANNGGRRSGEDRRLKQLPIGFEDRRSGDDRRSGLERRSGRDRRSPHGMRRILNLGRRILEEEVNIRR